MGSDGSGQTHGAARSDEGLAEVPAFVRIQLLISGPEDVGASVPASCVPTAWHRIDAAPACERQRTAAHDLADAGVVIWAKCQTDIAGRLSRTLFPFSQKNVLLIFSCDVVLCHLRFIEQISSCHISIIFVSNVAIIMAID
jgi:hypothetical protein